MGFLGGVSFGQLLIVFLIVAILFGTKKLRSIGEDLGQAVHGFKKGLKEGSSPESSETFSKTQKTEDSPSKHQAKLDN